VRKKATLKLIDNHMFQNYAL